MDTNLKVLRARDPGIEEILHRAKHVTFYQLAANEEGNLVWYRSEVEGPLFVVRRASDPAHRFIVLNRLSDEPFSDDIGEDDSFQFEHTGNFVNYQNGRGEDRGIWFYDPTERENFVKLMESLLDPGAEPPAPQPAGTTIPINQLFSLPGTPTPTPAMGFPGVAAGHQPHQPAGLPFPPKSAPGNLVDLNQLFTAPAPTATRPPNSVDLSTLIFNPQAKPPAPASTTTISTDRLFATAPPKQPATITASGDALADLLFTPSARTAAPAAPVAAPTTPTRTAKANGDAPAKASGGTPTKARPEGLSRSQFKQSLVSLIQRDDFIDTVYNHYLKRVQAQTQAGATPKQAQLAATVAVVATAMTDTNN